MLEVVPARAEHARAMAPQVRSIDALECRAAGRTPLESLVTGWAASLDPQVAMLDGQPVAMWGVVPVNALEGHGRPWLLATDAASGHPAPLMWGARAWLAFTRQRFPRLSNWCAAENRQAQIWLRRLGFTMGQQIDMRGVPMIPFEWRP